MSFKISTGNFGIICKKCLAYFQITSLAKNHSCEIESEINLENNFFVEVVKENKKLEKENKKYKERIYDLESKLKLEILKKDLIYKTIEQITKTNYESDLEYIKTTFSKSPKISPFKDEKKKKEHYISANKLIEKLENEKSVEEKKEIIQNVEKELEEKGKKYFDENLETLLTGIQNSFTKFEKERDFDSLKVIKDKRKKLLKFMGYEEYIKIIKDHYLKFTQIVDKNKIISAKNKNNKLVKELFTTFESRLCLLDTHLEFLVESEEIERFHIGLEFNKNKSLCNDFTIFNKNDLIKNLLTYDLAVNSIKQILIREFDITFKNVVYLGNPDKPSLEDPFAFYTLEKIDKLKVSKNLRCWKMDCRLEELSNELALNILNYLTDLFKNLYNLLYKDNDFRENLFDNHVMETEGRQILQNIVLVSNYYKFAKLVQSIIIDKCSYKATENDKFHLTADDKMCQKNFVKYSNTDFSNDIIENISALFTDPERDQIQKFVSKF